MAEEVRGEEIRGGGDRGDKRPPDVGGPDVNQDTFNYMNMKRTYDEYQNESLEVSRQNRSHFNKLMSDAQSHDAQLRQLSLQAMQNAIETANMVAKKAVENMDENHKQSIDHRDISTTANLGVGVMAETVAAAVAKSVDASITPVIQSLVISVAALTEMVKAMQGAKA